MRIVDLLSKDSILLNASPKNKAEAIDLLVDYRSRAERLPIGRLTRKAFWQEKKTARPPLARALPSRTQRMQP